MAFRVERARPFQIVIGEIEAEHPKIEADLAWLEGRLAESPELLGDKVPGLQSEHPVFKTRCKDSCCRLGASGGWRIYYQLDRTDRVVKLFFIAHKRVVENPGRTFLNQMIERAFSA